MTIKKTYPNTDHMFWHTGQGKSIPFPEVTHEHWSNIYWYHKMIYDLHGYSHLKKVINLALEEIEKRFMGVVLDWKPKYPQEIDWFNQFANKKMVLFEKTNKYRFMTSKEYHDFTSALLRERNNY